MIQALGSAGIKAVQTLGGDRYVLESMKSGGYSPGGSSRATSSCSTTARTGDGTLTGLMLAARVAETRRT